MNACFMKSFKRVLPSPSKFRVNFTIMPPKKTQLPPTPPVPVVDGIGDASPKKGMRVLFIEVYLDLVAKEMIIFG